MSGVPPGLGLDDVGGCVEPARSPQLRREMPGGQRRKIRNSLPQWFFMAAQLPRGGFRIYGSMEITGVQVEDDRHVKWTVGAVLRLEDRAGGRGVCWHVFRGFQIVCFLGSC